MTGPRTVISVVSTDRFSPAWLGIMSVGSAAWPAADLAIFIPFTTPDDITARRMFWRNGTDGTGTLDIGIYNASGTRLSSSGPTATSGSNTYQYVDIADVALSKNTVYYLAAVSSTAASGTFYRTASAYGTFDNGFPGFLGVLKQESVSSSTLPATATFAAWDNHADFVPVIGLTTSTSQPVLT
jgi:hypothetical protein